MGKAKYLALAAVLVANLALGITELTFERELNRALNESDLTPEEKVDHVLNRLGFGSHPEILATDSLLAYDANGKVNASKTHELIKTYIEKSLAPQKYNNVPLEALVTSFPSGNLSYTKITDDVLKYQAAIKALSADPTKQTELIAKRTEYIRYRANLVNAERARVLAYATTLKYPLAVRLNYLWFNRFNVAYEKASIDIPDYFARINDHIFGTFQGMLKMTANHPAMLAYLDNNSNFEKVENGKIIVPANENYAREIMELHTLGYSGLAISDIYQAARVLAGRGIDSSRKRFPYRAGYFNDHFHTAGKKRVRIVGGIYDNPDNFENELDTFLTDLALHERTALSVARMLSRHFVHDSLGRWADPVKREGWIEKPVILAVAADFTSTGGNLLSAYRTLFFHPDFWKRENYRTKLKDPLSLVVSVLRATGKSYGTNTKTLTAPLIEKSISALKDMNQDLFNCSPPTGYSDNSYLTTNSSLVLNFIRYVHYHATYAGDAEGYFKKSYDDEENKAQAAFGTAAYSPSSVLDGFFKAYRVYPANLVVPLPRETSKADSPLTILNAASHPDRYWDIPTKKWLNHSPVRSVASQFLGSAAFMNR